MQIKETVIRGGQVMPFWEKFTEEFRKICALNKGWDYKDLIVQVIVRETVGLETSWVMKMWYICCWRGHRQYKFDKYGLIPTTLLFPAVEKVYMEKVR